MDPTDGFLKIEGAPGESQDAQHKGEIDITSFEFGVRNELPGGKATFQEFHFTIATNKASPKLLLAVSTGTHFPKAILTCRKAGGKQEEFVKITMGDIMVTNLTTSMQNEAGQIRGIESVALTYSKIEFEYREQKADGSLGAPVRVGVDVKAGKKL